MSRDRKLINDSWTGQFFSQPRQMLGSRQLFQGREKENKGETGPDIICMINYSFKNARVLSMLHFSIQQKKALMLDNSFK